MNELKPFIKFKELLKRNARLKGELSTIEKDLFSLVTSEEFKQSILFMRDNFPDDFEQLKEAVYNYK